MIDRSKLKIDVERLNEINSFLLKDDNPLVDGLIKVIEKYGGVDEINKKANDSRKLENLMAKLDEKNSPYVKDLHWLQKQRDDDAFISIPEYRREILGNKTDTTKFDESFAITLEISACNFFPWIIEVIFLHRN